MDYQHLFARRAAKPAAALFRAGAAAPAGVIPLTYGFPDPGSFPIDDLIAAATRVLRNAGRDALQYGPIAGPEPFLDLLVTKLQAEGIPAGRDNLLTTSGGSQGIDLVAHLLINPGDPIVVEAPTFIGALQSFRNLEAEVHEVPVDGQGMQTDRLAETLDRLAAQGRRAKLIYTIPTFQNPSGTTLAEQRRQDLVDLARRHQVIVLEDDAYSELRFLGEACPSLYARDPEGWVVQARTFSKIVAAGLRLGYLVAPAALLPRLLQLKVDVGTSPLATHLAAAFAGDTPGTMVRLQQHIAVLRGVYHERRDAMLGALAEYAPPGVSWTEPEGGFFAWLTLPEGMDATALLPRAVEAGVSYIPGAQNYVRGDGRRNLRLAYSFLPPDQLVEGVRRLCRAIEAAQSRG
jgi:DNA-binding transcriptional MocR family regulator